MLADLLPRCSIVLVDRRQKRTDFLQRAVRRLGHRRTCGCVKPTWPALRSEVEAGIEPPFDAVTARGFGPPEMHAALGEAA